MKNIFCKIAFFLGLCMAAPGAFAQLLYDNGPFVTNSGTGVGGADQSRVQDSALGMCTSGLGNMYSNAGNAAYDRIADDFNVPFFQQWQIDSIVFYGYQPLSSASSSPFQAYNLRIWADSSGYPKKSALVFGDTTTNVMTRSVWTNAYRVSDYASGNNASRPIFANTCTLSSCTLSSGTYWLDQQATGSSAYTGPFANFITILGNNTTGNALQEIGGANKLWSFANDNCTVTRQGLPFKIYGTAILGVSENNFVYDLSLFPNPAADRLNVLADFKSKNDVRVSLSNLLGQVLVSEDIGETDHLNKAIDLSGFPQGVYSLAIRSGDHVITRKVIRQ